MTPDITAKTFTSSPMVAYELRSAHVTRYTPFSGIIVPIGHDSRIRYGGWLGMRVGRVRPDGHFVAVCEAIAIGVCHKGIEVGHWGGLRLGDWLIMGVEGIGPQGDFIAIGNPVPIGIGVERVGATGEFIAIAQAIAIIIGTTVEDTQGIGGRRGGIGAYEESIGGHHHGGAASIGSHCHS